MASAAEEPWNGGDFLFARLRAEDGSCGVGEAFVLLPETGVSPAQITVQLRGCVERMGGFALDPRLLEDMVGLSLQLDLELLAE